MSRRPVQARARERRESLLDATAALLARAGWAAVTTNAVAREAGAAVGTVYDYFPNKEVLLEALLARYQERLQATVVGALAGAGDDLGALVDRGVRAFARFYREEPGYAALWLGSQLVAPLRDAGAAWGREFGALLGELVRAHTGATRARAERVALTLVHAVSAVVSLAVTRPPREREALVDEAVALATAYVTSATRDATMVERG